MGGIEASSMLDMALGCGDSDASLRFFRLLYPELGFLLLFFGLVGRCWCAGCPVEGVGGLEAGAVVFAAASATGGVDIGAAADMPLGT
jgi:hypothetical protein